MVHLIKETCPHKHETSAECESMPSGLAGVGHCLQCYLSHDRQRAHEDFQALLKQREAEQHRFLIWLANEQHLSARKLS